MTLFVGLLEQVYSKEYVEQLKSLHEDRGRPRGFGGKIKNLGKFYKYMELWCPNSLIDYGCGKGHILSYIQEKFPNVLVEGYDPAIRMFSRIPKREYECLFSNDVLEHIEPNHLTSVLKHMNQISSKYLWLRIDTKPARKTLPDGRNAHLILESSDWWTNNITHYIDGKIVYSNVDKKGKFDVAIEK